MEQGWIFSTRYRIQGEQGWIYSTRCRGQGEKERNIFSQVKAKGGAKSGHIQSGTGYKGSKDWKYSTRYRIQGGARLDIFKYRTKWDASAGYIQSDMQDTRGARAGH